MSRCTNKKFEDMLHHYELDLLSDEDRRELELHLMDCNHCFEKVRRFQPAARHIRFNPKVRDIIGRIAADSDVETAPAPIEKAVPPTGKKLIPVFIPAFVVVIIILALTFKSWHLKILPTSDAVAAENRLAVMYFENLIDRQDPDRLGQIITSLLVTDLSESQYVHVVSTQRLYDLLRLIGRENDRIIDREVASKIAEKGKVKWILTGQILQLEPNLILRYEIMDVSSGSVVTSARMDGVSGEDIFSLIDRFTVDIKKTLTLPEEARLEPDRRVADVTTHSTEAYRLFVEGEELKAKLYHSDAIQKYEQALEYDSTFAMAYYNLATLKDRSYVDQAVKYSGNATRLEKYYIEALQAAAVRDFALYIEVLNLIIESYPDEKNAWRMLGNYYYQFADFESARRCLEKAVEIDPMYKLAYNLLAYTYDRLGDSENSILTINKYISLEPNEANPYDTRADLYARSGNLNQAIASYRKALEIKPDFYESLRKLGHMYLYRRDYAAADSCYRLLTQSADSMHQASGLFFPALIPMYQGKFKANIEAFDKVLTVLEADYPRDNTAYVHRLKALVYLQQKNMDAALRELETGMAINREKISGTILNDRHFYALMLAEKGDWDKADSVVESIRTDMAEIPTAMQFGYYFAAGAVAQARGEMESAIDNFEMASRENDDFIIDFMLATTYLKAGRLSQAVNTLEKRVQIYDGGWRLCLGTWNIKMHYLLGLAYEESRWEDKAIEQYRIFLDFWGGGDPGIDEVEDARERLTRLRSKS